MLIHGISIKCTDLARTVSGLEEITCPNSNFLGVHVLRQMHRNVHRSKQKNRLAGSFPSVRSASLRVHLKLFIFCTFLSIFSPACPIQVKEKWSNKNRIDISENKCPDIQKPEFFFLLIKRVTGNDKREKMKNGNETENCKWSYC